jgi:hypothetical protein
LGSRNSENALSGLSFRHKAAEPVQLCLSPLAAATRCRDAAHFGKISSLTNLLLYYLLTALEDDHDTRDLRLQPASYWTNVHVASLRLPQRRRGRELLKLNNIDFQKPAIAQSIAGFLLIKPFTTDTKPKQRQNNMNAKYRRVPAEFGPETRFEITPVAPAPFRAVQENRFEALKNILLEQRLERLGQPDLGTHVRRAANEAAALAWVTPYPLLVFPLLFEEKAATAVRQAGRQQLIRERSFALSLV